MERNELIQYEITGSRWADKLPFAILQTWAARYYIKKVDRKLKRMERFKENAKKYSQTVHI